MKIAEYKFTSTIDTLPTFPQEYTYTTTDTDNGDGTITRIIDSDTAPVSVSFNGKKGLLEVLSLDLSKATNLSLLFYQCSNLTSVNIDWSVCTPSVINGSFQGCSSLIEVDLSTLKTDNVTTLQSMFNGCPSLQRIIGISQWNVAKVTNLNYLFERCNALIELDLSSWNVQNVKTMLQTFNGCSTLTELDLSTWSPSLTAFSSCFSGCSNLETLKVDNFDVSQVKSFSNVFNACSKLTTLDLSKWNTSSVTDMQYMFFNCTSLYDVGDLSNWDVSKVKTMLRMFFGTAFTTIDFSNWKIRSLTTTDACFQGCSKLTSVNLSGWHTSKVSNIERMFNGCKTLVNINLSSWDLSSVTASAYAFFQNDMLETINLSFCSLDTINKIIQPLPTKKANTQGTLIITPIKSDIPNIDSTTLVSKFWKLSYDNYLIAKYKFNSTIDTLPTFNKGFVYTSTDEDNDDGTITRFIAGNTSPTSLTFNSCTGLLEVFTLDVSGLTSFASMFADCRYLTSLPDMTGWCTSKVKSLDSMFVRCNSLTSVKGCSSWDTSNVTTISQIFRNCNKISEIDFQNWDVRNITTMTLAFRDSSLSYLNTKGWIWSSTTRTTFTGMFYNCSSLTAIEGIEDWNLGGSINTSQMFQNCRKLTSLDLRNWNISSKCINFSQMFYGCSGLTSLDLRNWDIRSVTTTNSMLMNCSALIHLNLGGWSGTSLTDTDNMLSNCNNLIDVSMYESSVDFVNTVIGLLPTRTSDSYGNLNVSVENKGGNLGIDSTTAESKYWKLIINYAIAIYRFNKDIDTLPILNITDYSCLDTLNADESITRRVYYDSAPSSMSFNGATGLIEVISLDLSIISTLQDFFKGCTQLTNVRLDGINFRNITSVQGMFDGCSKFTTSDFSKLDLSSIDTFDRMFANCTSLEALDLSNVKLKSSATFNNFLSNTSSLRKIKILDVNFDISKILESLSARTSDNVGYLFLREDCPNDKNWTFIPCKDSTQTIYLPQQLLSVDGISDRLYWDITKGHYCIDKHINNGIASESKTVIDVPNLKDKIVLEAYSPSTHLFLNSDLPTSNARLISNYPSYYISRLQPSTDYTLQFTCKDNVDPMIIRFGGKELEVNPSVGVNQFRITTSDSIINTLSLISSSGSVYDVMVLKGFVNQIPLYIDNTQSVGKLQSDGSYEITINSSSIDNSKNFSVTIKSSKPLGNTDKLYWDKGSNCYVIDRDGILEYPTVEGDVIDLPRLFQEKGTYITISTDNIKPSLLKVSFKYIDDLA